MHTRRETGAMHACWSIWRCPFRPTKRMRRHGFFAIRVQGPVQAAEPDSDPDTLRSRALRSLDRCRALDTERTFQNAEQAYQFVARSFLQ